MGSCMKVQTKSLSQRGTYLVVTSLICGLFYNNLSSWFGGLSNVVFAGAVILLQIIFFWMLPTAFWVSLAVLLVSCFIEDRKKAL